MATCEDVGAYVTITGSTTQSMIKIALSIPDSDWRPFRTDDSPKRKGASSRKKRENLRRKHLEQRYPAQPLG
jgi:hypothetical protein